LVVVVGLVGEKKPPTSHNGSLVVVAEFVGKEKPPTSRDGSLVVMVIVFVGWAKKKATNEPRWLVGGDGGVGEQRKTTNEPRWLVGGYGRRRCGPGKEKNHQRAAVARWWWRRDWWAEKNHQRVALTRWWWTGAGWAVVAIVVVGRSSS
jgi:hypothetical protein